MSPVEKQVPQETLEVLLRTKEEMLNNISSHYREELNDANLDAERLFKYGFVPVALVLTIVGGLAVVLLKTSGAALFVAALLFLALAIQAVLYERVRIEKATLSQQASAAREPIMQQIAMLKGFLEPGDD
jgi:hypothetical protein